MRKLVLIGLGVVGALLAAAPALAKEMTLEQVCGTNGCNAVKPGLRLGHDGFGGGAAPALEDYYIVQMGVGDGRKIFEHFRVYFAPKAGAIVSVEGGPTDGWARLPARAAAAIRASAKGLKPFKAPRASRVYVNDHQSVDPAPYTDLLGPLDPAPVPQTSEELIPLSISWARPNPWSYDGSILNYLPQSGMLMRGDGYFHVPESLAARIDRERRGLPPVAPGGGFPWSVFAGALAGALALVTVTAVVYWRRRPGPAERAVPA